MGALYQYRNGPLYLHYSLDEIPNPGHFYMHVHHVYEILYIIRGKGSFYVEGKEYRISDGCYIFTRPGETHKMNIDTSVPYERIGVHFPAELLEQFDPDKRLLNVFCDRSLGTHNFFAAYDLPSGLGTELMKLAEPQCDDYRAKLSMSIRIGAFLLEVSGHFERNRASLGAQASGDVIANVIEYINENLFSDFNLDSLSKMFYISKSYLERRFKQVTGSTVWDYVLIKRLFVARESILSGDPPTKVYLSCGFKDYSSFFRQYKNRFGVSPNEDKRP